MMAFVRRSAVIFTRRTGKRQNPLAEDVRSSGERQAVRRKELRVSVRGKMKE